MVNCDLGKSRRSLEQKRIASSGSDTSDLPSEPARRVKDFNTVGHSRDAPGLGGCARSILSASRQLGWRAQMWVSVVTKCRTP